MVLLTLTLTLPAPEQIFEGADGRRQVTPLWPRPPPLLLTLTLALALTLPGADGRRQVSSHLLAC